MSFTFQWPRFSEQFHADAIQMLNNALNKGNKPPVIADKIEVVELEMGTQPPELEIRDIGELTMDQFRGIFRLSYSGDAYIVLKTKVQANPLNHKQPDIHLMSGSRGMLAAKQPLAVPMHLRLSHFKLNSYVVLVVSKQKGITLVFKTDPLQNVDINSTFDSIAVIQKFIQREIEGQLRQMFREDLPGIIHRLSQQWIKAKVETPYVAEKSFSQTPPARRPIAQSLPGSMFHTSPITPISTVGLNPFLRHQPSLAPLPFTRPRSVSGVSATSTSRRAPPSVASAPSSVPESTFPEIEDFDPTYGLRPDDIPAKSIFGSFSNLFAPNKGLGDLAEDPREGSDYADSSSNLDFGEWDDPDGLQRSDDGQRTEYESIPAVGGGVITRPRVLHSQSVVSSPVSSARQSPNPSHLRRLAASYDHRPTLPPLSVANVMMREPTSYFSDTVPRYGRPVSEYSLPTPLGPHLGGRALSEVGLMSPYSHSASLAPPTRPKTPDSLETQPSGSTSALPTPPSSNSHDAAQAHATATASSSSKTKNEPEAEPAAFDREDAFAAALSPNDSLPAHHLIPEPTIVLRPSTNNSIHHLSTLSHSNHTLSPYTRSVEHFTVRSGPPRTSALGLSTNGGGPSGAMERQPVKARRKRIHRLGSSKAAAAETQQPVMSPPPPPEFDASDMDQYFRSRSDLGSPVPPPQSVQHQQYQHHPIPSSTASLPSALPPLSSLPLSASSYYHPHPLSHS